MVDAYPAAAGLLELAPSREQVTIKTLVSVNFMLKEKRKTKSASRTDALLVFRGFCGKMQKMGLGK
jgi:hypothetical protein